ncbi:hypothetical protein BDB00DRAFT_809526 [Zychaea mexicana]|uniref:uncharacterized protein n=1 Tax=Zychaea mexicana TaxID=64656 RepID=UPI0022FF195B|nr:uncharacterized protein BDB00DRAFT_809526 [Zychaea mexicana]KAI9496218.1 hypothetical protein BDB00DRAFT_809526 [Zychaea mexicana]
MVLTTRRAGLCLALLGLMALTADAHVVFTTDETLPGVQLNTSLAVGHGCDGSPTVELSVSVPDQITSVEPQEIDGWNLTLIHRNGSSGPISNFTWVGGPLEDTSYQAFGVLIQVPDIDVSQQNVTLYFPAVQRCENGTREWVFEGDDAASEAAGQSPAPALTITSTPSSPEDDGHSSGDDSSSRDDESGAQQFFGLSAAVLASAIGAAYQLL